MSDAMNLILLDLGQNGYHLICVPKRIAENAQLYQKKFDEWLFDPESEHHYWCKDGEGNLAVSYDGAEAFVKWLNEMELGSSEGKAQVIPVLHF